MTFKKNAVEINLNPYQGLKPAGIRKEERKHIVEINLNPYQGLKLVRFAH